VELERSTLADWVGGTSALLAPLVEALRRHVMAATKLHADDTPVPVLSPGNGKTKTGRLWTYVRDDRPAGDATPAAVWFAYTPDRKGERPQAHLRSFTGTLQADGYAGFEQIYEAGRIQEAACWAHVRRKFYDLLVAHKSQTAAEALERIGALYAIEKDIRGRSPEERREVRATRARPLLGSLKQWLETTLCKLSRKSDTALAVRYALGRAAALRGRRPHRNRQQRCGTCVARGRAGPQKLLVRWLGRWRRTRRRNLQPDRHGQAERH
jgi:transposase